MTKRNFINKAALTISLLSFFSFTAFAQKPSIYEEYLLSTDFFPQIDQIMDPDEKTKKDLEKALRAVSNQDIESAFISFEDFWHFTTHPDTPFIHRLAAVERAFGVFDLSEIAVLAHAKAEIESLMDNMGWASDFSWSPVPLIFTDTLPNKVLGYDWDKNSIDFRSDKPGFDAFTGTPYPWQLYKSLGRLLSLLKGRLIEPENQRIWLEAALKMPLVNRTRGRAFAKEIKIQNRAFFIASEWIVEAEPDKWDLPLYLEVLKKWYAFFSDSDDSLFLSEIYGTKIVSNWNFPEGYWLGNGFILLDHERIKLGSVLIDKLESPSPNPGRQDPYRVFIKLGEFVIYETHTFFPKYPFPETYIQRAENFLKLVGEPVDVIAIQKPEPQVSPQRKLELEVRMEALLARIEAQLEILKDKAALEKPYLDWARSVLTSGRWIDMP